MARITEFTREVVLDRAQPSNIDSAFRLNGGNQARDLTLSSQRAYRAADAFGSLGDQFAQQQKASAQLRAHEVYNGFQRSKIEYMRDQQNQRMTSPDGFTKDMDSWFMQSQSDLEDQLSNSEDNQPFDLQYFRRLMDQERTSTLAQSDDWENGMRLQNVTVGTERNIDEDNVNFALSNPRMADLPKQLSKQRDYVNTVGKNVLSPQQNQKLFQYGADKSTAVVMDSMLENDPRALKDVIYYGAGTKDQLIEMTMYDIEGGDRVVAEPGGGIAKFGISSDLPGERRSGLTADQVKSLTPESAREWYSKNWDARLDKMDPAFRAVAYDAIVNHGNDKDTWNMINKSNGDPYTLIEMRREKYAGLIAANPEKYAKYKDGWDGRMQEMTRYAQSQQSGREFMQHAALLDPAIIMRTRAQIPGAVDAKRRQEAAVQSQKLSTFNTQYKNLYDAMTKNMEPIGQDEIDSLQQLAINSGDPEAINRANAMSNMRTYVGTLKGLGEDQLRKAVRAASAEVNKNPNADTRLVLELTEGAFRNHVEGVQNEGIAYYGRTGQISMPQPLNYAQPQQAMNELAMREQSARSLYDRTGKLMPVLTPDEVVQLKDQFENMPANEMAGLLTVYDALGAQAKHELARAVNDKSPIVATAISVENPEARRRLIHGAKIEAKYKKEDMRANIEASLDPMVVDPAFKTQAVEAVSAYYNALSSEARDFSENIETDRIDKAITDLYGPRVDISFVGTNEVFSFRDLTAGNNYVPEDDIYNMFNGINDDQLKAMFGDLPKGAMGETVTAKDIKENGRIVSAGDGLYNVVFDNIGGLYDNKGRLVEIDGRQLLTLYRKSKK